MSICPVCEPGEYVCRACRPRRPCPTCGGTGNRNFDVELDDMIVDEFSDEDCPDCAGSGTTLDAAQAVGRHAIGIDLDPRNAWLARDRVGMFLDIKETV